MNLKRVIWIGVGAGVGYVLGSRAGRERYDEIRDQAQQAWSRVGGADAAQSVSSSVADLTDTVSDRVAEGVGAASGAVTDVVDSATDHLRTADTHA